MNDTEKLNIDQLVAKRGVSHIGKLAEITARLRTNMTEQEKLRLFGEKVTDDLDEKLNSEGYNTSEGFDKFYKELQTFDSTKSPGHDFAHLTDTLTSAVRIEQQYPSLTSSQRLEVMVACLMHDLGRFVEPSLEEQMDKKGLELLAPLFVGKELQRRLTKVPDALSKRVIFDIATGSEPKTDILTADIVHQCDREQLMGSATIFRGLAFDVGIAGRNLTIPLISGFRTRLPMPESETDRYWLIQYEFFMRNVYPPVSPDGKEVANKNKKENAVILMLAMEGKGQEYFNQVFGPELGLVKQGDEGVHWSKKPILQEVFEAAKVEESDFLKEIEQLGVRFDSNIDYLAGFTKQAIITDKVVLPVNFDSTIKEKLEKCDDQERKNYWTILIYTLIKRHQKRISDIKFLETIHFEEGESFKSKAKELLLKELGEREQIFASNFPFLAKLAKKE